MQSSKTSFGCQAAKSGSDDACHRALKERAGSESVRWRRQHRKRLWGGFWWGCLSPSRHFLDGTLKKTPSHSSNPFRMGTRGSFLRSVRSPKSKSIRRTLKE